jgi:hypothetical protein
MIFYLLVAWNEQSFRPYLPYFSECTDFLIIKIYQVLIFSFHVNRLNKIGFLV